MVDTTSSLTFRADSSQIVTATNNLNANAAAAGRTEQAAQRAGRAYGGLGHIAGQAGFQIQDATVQLQMGTNAMVVLAQQGSQFAGVFGPTGAVVGAILAIGAATVGTLLPSLFDSKDAVEELEKAMQSLSGVVDEVKPNVFELAEALNTLSSESELAAQAAVRSAVLKGKKEIKTAIDGLKDITNDFVDSVGTSATFGRLTFQGREGEAFTVAELMKDKLFETREEAFELRKAFLAFGKGGKTVESLGDLRLSVDELFLSMSKPTDEFIKFRDELAELDDAAKKADRTVSFLSDSLARATSGQETIGDQAFDLDPFEGIDVRARSFIDAEAEMASQILDINKKAAEEQQKQDKKAADERIRTAQRVARERIRAEQMVAMGIANIGGQIADIIGQNAEEGSTQAKAAYLINQGIQAAMAFNSANVAYAGVIASAAAIPDPTGATLAAGLARAELIRGLGYASAALIAGNAVGTVAGRAQGGQVRAGEAYRVGEFGPETLIMGNQSGTITNKPMGGAPVEIVNNITVEGSGNAEVETSTRQVSDTKFVQDIIIREMGNQNSASRRALSSTSNVKGVGTR